jgi:hypothetical protein
MIDEVLASASVLKQYPELANAEVLERVRKMLKGCPTTNRDRIERGGIVNMVGYYYKYVAGFDNYRNPRMEYVRQIEKMTDDQLDKETGQKIWLSAYANNNPRSDFHWHVDLLNNEWDIRGQHERYGKIYDRVYKENFG